jgi:pre-rRNA-processing protein TSR4
MELGFVTPASNADPTGLVARSLTSNWRTWDGGICGEFICLQPMPDLPAKCDSCQSPLYPLLQVYAPLDDVPDAFHRDLYVLLCPKESCEQRVAVYRSQLPRENAYYPFNPPVVDATSLSRSVDTDVPSRASWCDLALRKSPALGLTVGNPDGSDSDEPGQSSSSEDDDDEQEQQEKGAVKRCAVCSQETMMRCSSCRKVFYCTREHQVEDWKAGHKETCNDLSLCQSELDEALSMGDAQVFGKLAAGKDKQFEKFKRAVRTDPDQVLRYNRWSANAKPLWLCSRNMLDASTQVPPCEACGAPRMFEMQLLPQLVHFLPSAPDFATLVVYTCTKSCSRTFPLAKEFAYHQKEA